MSAGVLSDPGSWRWRRHALPARCVPAAAETETAGDPRLYRGSVGPAVEVGRHGGRETGVVTVWGGLQCCRVIGML